MTIQIFHDQKENRRTGDIIGETIYFESKGWWGDGPLSFRRRYDSWSMSTTSGGQSQGIDVLDQIREMKAMLDYAEKAIIKQRSEEVV